MEKDLIFFKKEGEEGVALTTTSANHIANLAKEYIQGVEIQLNNISFYNTEIALIGSSDANITNVGDTLETLRSSQSMLEKIAQAKSLIAWLREGIKTKESLFRGLLGTGFDDWCKENGITKPESPCRGHVLTESEYYASLPIKERNRYYQLETEAAVIGEYIHPNGSLSIARKELKDKIQHPHVVEGKGRDTLIYTYVPTIEITDVDNVFFELQRKHREVQAQLNSMKYSCEQAINESTNRENSEFKAASLKYQAELQDILASFKIWRDEKSQEYSKLKIVIPHSLLGIYNIINSLGK